MNIGLYFGSFNPIHNGHLIIANFVLQNTETEQVWFVISPQNPLKKSSTLLNEYHRLYLVQASIEDEAGLKASDIEFRLPRPSYTIDTITYLDEKYPTHKFSIILGSDSYQNLSSWKNYEQLLKQCPLIIYKRPGFSVDKKYPLATTTTLDAPLLDISSTYIRKTIRAGRSIRFLVPDVVKAEIERNGYYRGSD